MAEENVLGEVWAMWTSGRRGEIAALLEQQGDSTEVLKRYLGLQGDLYWEKKDLEAVLALSGFGRAFAERHGRREAENVLLYNIGTFTLPWWSDSLPSTPWQRLRGFNAARAVLFLRRTLGKESGDLSKAYWLLGAHHLYRGNAAPAVENFSSALAKAREARDKNLEACALEGLGRTRVRLLPKDRDWGFESLGEARTLYAEVGDKFNLGELERFMGEPPT
ncbi:MAG: hypothetical protein ACYTHM_09650 [Planctomycetota bacterium]